MVEVNRFSHETTVTPLPLVWLGRQFLSNLADKQMELKKNDFVGRDNNLFIARQVYSKGLI